MGVLAQSAARIVCILVALFCIAATSYVTISSDQVGQLKRVYFGKQLPAGRIIALDGENGPQADILGPGFHFRLFLNVLYTVEKEDVYEVPPGKYAKLVARDGKPLNEGQVFAVKPTGGVQDLLDAKTFLESGGQKGEQVFVLTPGKWRLNKFLWSPELDDATEIEKGIVGVVKSNAHSEVHMGDMELPLPVSCAPVTEEDLSGGKLAVPLVPVGCIGIWDQPLMPGKYFLNKDVYKVTLVDTRVQTWEFKGGFKKRSIKLTVDQQGKISQEPSETDEPFLENKYSDRAVFLKVEGWDVPQELRVLVQIPPKNAPIVVASVGDEKEVEHRIIVPIVRSIVRDITGGGVIEIEELNDKGELVKTRRPPRVLDLLDNRAVLESKILAAMKREGTKAGVDIKEVRFGDPAIPPELLVARLREQLAQQLSASYQQEKIAQEDRVKTENARATADQQGDLVRADIEQQRASRIKAARQLEGEGERLKLEAIAQGQKQQAAVLGEDRVVELRKYELMMDRIFALIEKNPEIVVQAFQNAGKLVPDTVISTGGGQSLEGSMAILGQLLSSGSEKKQAGK